MSLSPLPPPMLPMLPLPLSPLPTPRVQPAPLPATDPWPPPRLGKKAVGLERMVGVDVPAVEALPMENPEPEPESMQAVAGTKAAEVVTTAAELVTTAVPDAAAAAAEGDVKAATAEMAAAAASDAGLTALRAELSFLARAPSLGTPCGLRPLLCFERWQAILLPCGGGLFLQTPLF